MLTKLFFMFIGFQLIQHVGYIPCCQALKNSHHKQLFKDPFLQVQTQTKANKYFPIFLSTYSLIRCCQAMLGSFQVFANKFGDKMVLIIHILDMGKCTQLYQYVKKILSMCSEVFANEYLKFECFFSAYLFLSSKTADFMFARFM